MLTSWSLRRRAGNGRSDPAATVILTATALLLSEPAGSARAGELIESLIGFTEEAIPRGLVYSMSGYPQAYGHSGFGCGFADLSGNGAPDAVILGAASTRVGVFENDGRGHFTDRSQGRDELLLPQGVGVAMGDYNGDGLIDLYFTQVGLPNVLLRNDGDFEFVDVTAQAGAGDPGAGAGAAWGDYDNDGWLDLYVCNYNGAVQGTVEMHNVLYRNNGDGTMSDVGAALGVDGGDNGLRALSFQPTWFDMNHDGWLDLYVANDRGMFYWLYQANQLWRNDEGAFTNVSEASGAGVALYAMGVACGDVDGNGFADLYVTNIAGYAFGYNPLLLNQGDESFVEASADAGVDHWTTSWGAIFFDFTNNGWHDLYVNNQFAPNHLYLHEGEFPLTDVAAEVGVQAPSGYVSTSWSSAVADVNADGALDLMVNNLNQNVLLYINHDGIERHWIRYAIVGIWPNHHAAGASVRTRLGDRWIAHESHAGGNGYLNQNERIIHVGLDDASHIDEAVIRWPGGGGERVITNYAANVQWMIYPPSMLGDADGDGFVNVGDLQALLSAWGPVAPGSEMLDIIGDAEIDAFDLLALLGRWSAAPSR